VPALFMLFAGGFGAFALTVGELAVAALLIIAAMVLAMWVVGLFLHRDDRGRRI
jgi:hypothetical protein